MARKKDRKKGKRNQSKGVPSTQDHVLDRLYLAIDTHKDADPDSTPTLHAYSAVGAHRSPKGWARKRSKR
jgi:hypothetical protein